MNSSEVDKFYRKVIKDFIVKLGKQEYLLRELQQNQIYLNQVEQKMFQKLQQSSRLFKRLTGGYNEIEKDMMSRFTATDDIHSVSRQQIKNTVSRSIPQQQSNLSSFSQDLNLIDHRSEAGAVKKQNVKEEEIVNDSYQQPEEEKGSIKRKASELSNEDFSEISEQNYEDNENTKKLREGAKIHILGTYDSYVKKYNFKQDDTEIKLQNVFIKMEGMAKEMFIKKLNCFCQKKTLQ